MKRSLYILRFLLILLPMFSIAQQTTQRTQFYMNRFSLNPAVAGSVDHVPILVNVRQQWVGIEDAPTTQTFSAHAFTGKGLGMGVLIHNDVAGPTRNTGFTLSSAYHLHLSKRRDDHTWLSFGLAGNLYQYFFDAEQLQTEMPDDPAVTRLLAEGSKLTPDISAGLYLTTPEWFVGFSALNLIETDTDIFSRGLNPNSIKRIYYLMAGYRFDLVNDLSIEPAGLARYTSAGVFQSDLMLKGYYMHHYLGVLYRTSDAIAVLLGLNIEDVFEFGYSYDITVSDISEYNNGTHEVTLVFNLYEPISKEGRVRQQPKKRRRRR